jgi:LmbE family N-acetylglucosaminyl deacetylase
VPWSTVETSEETWRCLLKDTPGWELPEKPTVVMSPHPDDETLGAGGLIRVQTNRGVPVTMIAVTDGEAAYPNFPGLATTRIAEQNAAAQALGVASDRIVRLKIPDSKVSEFEHELAVNTADHLDADTLLIAPWTLDPHPDHEACGRAAVEAARVTGAIVVFYIFWAWHRNLPKSLIDLPLRRLEIPPNLQEARSSALACHLSQLERPGSDPILPEIFLAPARRSYEIFIVN